MTSATAIWRQAILHANATIQEAISNLNQVCVKIVMVVNTDGALQGTISDGDIRRGLLRGLDLNSPITSILQRHPLVVPPGMSRDMVMQLMVANKVQQIPAVDEERRVVGLHLWEEIVAPPARPNLMVIMAGGRGTRLHPYTETCPKPMLPVNGKPMLDRVVTAETPLGKAAKCALISFASTLRSNVTVGMPIDLLIYRRDSLQVDFRRRYPPNDAYFDALSSAFGEGIVRVFDGLPDPT